MIVTTIQIQCDDCLRFYRGPRSKAATGAQVRDAARAQGWQVGVSRGRDYCPEHRHERGLHHP